MYMYMYVSFFYFSPEAIKHAAEAWGIRCMRYEIKDIMLPTKVKEAMQMQVSGLVHVYMFAPSAYWKQVNQRQDV